MKLSTHLTSGFVHALGVFLYVLAVALFLQNAKVIFGEKEPEGLFVPVFMLLLFIISATITGFLVLGKPALWYINGKKQEALYLLFATLGWLITFLLLVAIFLFVQ
jgi:hypothetical protein